MVLYGYIKCDYPVPTAEQLAAIEGYGYDTLFIDNGECAANSQFKKMLDNFTANDQLIVYDLKVIFQSFKQLKVVLERIKLNNIRLISIRDELDTENNRMFLESALLVLDTGEEYRKDYTRQRVNGKRSQLKAQGRPQVEQEVVNKIQYLFKSQKKTMRDIAEICNVSLGTVHKYVKIM